MCNQKISLSFYQTMKETITNYYFSQTGSGYNSPVYSNSRFFQRGRGYGNFFASLLSHIQPFIISGLNALKKQGIKTGTAILEQLGSKPFGEIIKEQGKKAITDLTQKGFKKLKRLQDGSGTSHSFTFKDNIKKKGDIKKHQSITNSIQRRLSTSNQKKKKKKKSVVRKLKNKIKDIFTNK